MLKRIAKFILGAEIALESIKAYQRGYEKGMAVTLRPLPTKVVLDFQKSKYGKLAVRRSEYVKVGDAWVLEDQSTDGIVAGGDIIRIYGSKAIAEAQITKRQTI
jgi:hypothetical protein